MEYKYFELERYGTVYETCRNFEDAKYIAGELVYGMGFNVEIYEVNEITGNRKLVYVVLDDDMRGEVIPMVPHLYVKVYDEDDE